LELTHNTNFTYIKAAYTLPKSEKLAECNMEGHPILASVGLAGVLLSSSTLATGLEAVLFHLMDLLGLALLPIPIYLVGRKD